MNKIVEHLKKDFTNKFGVPPLMVKAPGKINLLGEHTDYHEGFVLSAAISMAAYVAIQKSNSDDCTIIALDYSGKIQFDLHTELVPILEGDWVNYVVGVVDQFKKRGAHLEGFNLIFSSDIPIGAGMGSSSAIVCGIAWALNKLFDLGLSNHEIAKVGQAAENGFVGSESGLQDMLATCMGKRGQALMIDCRTLEYAYVPVDLGSNSLILLDTKIKQNTFHAEYKLRKEECKIGLLSLRGIRPDIVALRDATLDDLLSLKDQMDPIIYKRCKYVIEENLRVIKACSYLKEKNLVEFGKLMIETHMGLRKLYEVSCRELNVLGRLAKYEDDVIGARIMGKGFGGCTINIIKTDKVRKVVNIFREEYRILAMGEFKAYKVNISDGISVLDDKYVEV